MDFLHAHRRRVPAQDIGRSVVPGIGFMAAVDADETRLAFAVPSVDATAGRTGLRRVSGIYEAEESAPSFELVGKDSRGISRRKR
jgi:hypothetical protein